MRLVIPMPGDVSAVAIEGPFPLTVEEWVYLHGVLDAMRPGIVVDGVRVPPDLEIQPRQPEPDHGAPDMTGEPDEEATAVVHEHVDGLSAWMLDGLGSYTGDQVEGLRTHMLESHAHLGRQQLLWAQELRLRQLHRVAHGRLGPLGLEETTSLPPTVFAHNKAATRDDLLAHLRHEHGFFAPELGDPSILDLDNEHHRLHLADDEHLTDTIGRDVDAPVGPDALRRVAGLLWEGLVSGGVRREDLPMHRQLRAAARYLLCEPHGQADLLVVHALRLDRHLLDRLPRLFDLAFPGAETGVHRPWCGGDHDEYGACIPKRSPVS